MPNTASDNKKQFHMKSHQLDESSPLTIGVPLALARDCGKYALNSSVQELCHPTEGSSFDVSGWSISSTSKEDTSKRLVGPNKKGS
jgi:hypothetical protein